MDRYYKSKQHALFHNVRKEAVLNIWTAFYYFMGFYFEPFSIIFFTFKTEQMIIREFVTEVNMKFDKFIFSSRRRHEIKASKAKHNSMITQT